MKMIWICLLLCVGNVLGQRTLESYNVDRSMQSVSGISSGACMANQYHVAYSATVMGAGIIAGVPYYCADASAGDALTCMEDPNFVDDAFSAQKALEFESEGSIDPTGNINGDNVFVFNGNVDSTVDVDVGRKVVSFYNRFGANVLENFNIAAEHGFPTMNRGVQCDTQDSTYYINWCSYEASYELLNHIYGGLQRPDQSTPLNGDLYEFDAREFFEASFPVSWSMDTVGYVYVPSNCVSGVTACKLHTVFHGCSMQREEIGTYFIDNSGYNQVGELNDIIMLYPQTVGSVMNPVNAYGCWDWWGYNDIIGNEGVYAKQDGAQPLAARRMMMRLAGDY